MLTLARKAPTGRSRRLTPRAALFLLVSSPSLASAADYFVATSGSDRNPGTEAAPFASIRQAASVTNPGDNVFIRGGTYTQGVTVARSGSAGAWITFAAYPGEVPVLEGGGGGGTGFNIEASFIRVRGLVARNWSASGFANGWDVSPGNVEFIELVAEGNGINGIAFYKATGVRIESCIVAHNGNQQPSWSSGVNLFQVGGTHADNVVRGTVSFENIDISDNHTDGNGFIVDEGSTGALFENNIGFRNGGSCIRLTNSSGSHLINNTCFQNGLDPNNTPAFVADEIFFSDPTTRIDTVVKNNLAVAVRGKAGLSHDSGTGASVFESNFVVDDGGASPFFISSTGALDLRVVEGSMELIDRGTAVDAPAVDSGFDFRCVRPQGGQALDWWQYAPDYEYIRAAGGVAACFAPVARPLDAGPDIGAYEFGFVPPPCGPADCSTNSACASDPACAPPVVTEPAPGATGSVPMAGADLEPGIPVVVPGDSTAGAPNAEPVGIDGEPSGPAEESVASPVTPSPVAPSPMAGARGGGCSLLRQAAPEGGRGVSWLFAGLGLLGWRRRAQARRARGVTS